MNYDLVIRNGRVITGCEDFVADVAITGQQIAAIGQSLSGKREIEAQGLYSDADPPHASFRKGIQ